MLRAVLVLVFFLSTASAYGEIVCSSRELAEHQAAEADRIRAAMRGVHPEEMSTEVPAFVQILLPQFKLALTNTVRSVLACSEAKTDPADVTAHLAQLLLANRPEPAPGTSVSSDDPRHTEALSFDYGADLQIHVERLSLTLLSVQSSFGIQCGKDTVWQLFEFRQGRWVESLVWMAQPYKEINGAFGDFFVTAILSGTGRHPLRVVAAHGHPWCTSRFSGFGIDLLEPTEIPEHPRVIWHTTRGYSRGDFETTLHASGDTFELRVHAPAWDATEYERAAIYRYRVDGDQVTRLEPIAGNGQGFVDEWLESPWDEAAAQTAPDHLAALKVAHDAYQRAEKPSGDDFLRYANGPVRACRQSGVFQVQVDLTHEFMVPGKPGGKSVSLTPSFYVIQQVENGYRMLNVGHVPDPGCTGPDLMRKH